MNKTGNKLHYWTYDTEPSPVDGKYHVGEGTRWDWIHRGAFKTAKAAHNWAIRKNYGRDEYND